MYIYGSDKKEIEELIGKEPELGEKLHPKSDFTKAEVVWAIRFEMARTIEDVLARRVRLLFLNARAAIISAPIVAELLAKELAKNKDWERKEIDNFTKIAKQYVL